jgi:hypothetical protein
VIAPYAGKYHLDQYNMVSFVKAEGGHLYLSDDGNSWDEVYAESDTLFFFKGRNITLRFIKDTNGKVNGIEIDREGTKINGRRIE